MKKAILASLIALMTFANATPVFTASPNKAADTLLNENQVIKIALNDAKLKEDDVTFNIVHLNAIADPYRFEVEFTRDNQEYDYDIDARTGEIISVDHELDENTDFALVPGACIE